MPDRLDFQKLSFGVRRMGWIRFWIQVVLGIVVVGVLLFNNIGGSLARNSERAVGLGPGLSLTSLAFLVLLFSLWQGWLIVRTGRAIDSGARPSRGEVARLIKRGLLADLLGLTFATIGYQALAGSLFVQASMQTPGIAIGGRGMADNLAITSLEMLSCAQQHPGAVRPPDRCVVLPLVAAAGLPHQLILELELRKSAEGPPPEQVGLDRRE
jgi:hypothetical protein